MLIAISSAGLTDTALAANSSIVAVALAAHPLSQQFGSDSIAALAAIAERSPPTVSAGELAFLRDAVRVVEAAEIAGSADGVVAGREART